MKSYYNARGIKVQCKNIYTFIANVPWTKMLAFFYKRNEFAGLWNIVKIFKNI